MDNSAPVVVLKDQGGHAAVAVARSLGRLGIPTYLVSEDGPSAVGASRYWTNRFAWDLSGPNDQSLRTLLDAGREIGSRPVLLAIADSTALFIEKNASVLEKYFIFPKAPPPLIQALTNKWQMFAAAKEHGIPTPEVMYPRSRADVVNFIKTARFPIVLKGAVHLLPQAKWKTIVHTTAELLEKYNSASASGNPNLILQEYMPGDDESVWMCNAYFGAGSECRAIFSGKKIRQTPPPASISTLAVR